MSVLVEKQEGGVFQCVCCEEPQAYSMEFRIELGPKTSSSTTVRLCQDHTEKLAVVLRAMLDSNSPGWSKKKRRPS